MKLQRTLVAITAALLAGACVGATHPALAASGGKISSATPAGNIRYTVTDLGTLPGGSYSTAMANSTTGLVAGGSDAADGLEHAVVWLRGRLLDIGASGFNSDAFAVNPFGQVAGQTETDQSDPIAENFCGYGSGRQCRPFAWQAGRMKLLPLLGGNNGTTGDNVNLFGQIPGVAETGQADPNCPQELTAVGTGPQRLSFKPVVWGPKPGSVRELATLPGDDVGMAFWINDLGQAVGVTGTCANTTLPPLSVGRHAVLWERGGTPVDLGNLGGVGDPAQPGVGNVAHAINNRGQVVGVSALAGNTAAHGFLWTRAQKMRSLDPLPGQTQSGAIGINNFGDAVGVSFDGMLWDAVQAGTAGAVIWRNGGAPADLNQLVAQPTPLYLLFAIGINDAGEIVGFAFDTKSEEVHAFRATPVRRR
ncbi:MAG: hypothetical protein EPN38_02140 [Rhodanobacteraceae bacterium]|nr:MAG: hypothetical protein EPN38_02140 [Rhodanobacteraceae bacterium]